MPRPVGNVGVWGCGQLCCEWTAPAHRVADRSDLGVFHGRVMSRGAAQGLSAAPSFGSSVIWGD